MKLGQHTVGIQIIRQAPKSLLILLACFVGSCSLLQDETKNDKPIGRVFDKYLYKEDIANLIPNGTSPDDSIKLVKRYLDTWVKQELILNKAQLNLSDNQAFSLIEKQLDDYRTSLIIYAYQQELIKQKLDTIVSDKEVQEYYNENANNLLLRDDIVRVRYIKVPKGAPKIKLAKIWCESKEEEDLVALKDYCHQYAKSFLLNDREWIILENLQMELGAEISINIESLEPEKLMERQDSLHIYLINILDLKEKDNPAPIAYKKNKIREILLNRRRSELISNMETNTYQDGLRKKYFEVY